MNTKIDYDLHFSNIRKILNDNNLLEKTPIYGFFLIFLSFLAFFLWLLLIWKINIIFTILYFYILIVELGYISHDLIHNQYFKNIKYNSFFSYINWNLLIWLSNWWWRKKHNVEHHSFTNSDIHDTDIRDYDEIFTKNKWKSDFFYKYRKYLFWIVTSVLYLNLILQSFIFVIKNKKLLELFFMIINLFLLPLFLFLNYSYFWFLYLLIIYVLVWIHLAFVFMVYHIWMEIIDWIEVKKYKWLDLQTRTTRNIKGWVFINHIFGWLNKQIEHHIFPTLSRKNILKASVLVKKYCRENNIKYHEVSFFEWLKEIMNTLKTWETK